MSRAFCSHAGGSFGALASVDGGGDEIGCGGAWATAAVDTQASSSATQRMVRAPPGVDGGTLPFLRVPSSGEGRARLPQPFVDKHAAELVRVQPRLKPLAIHQ